MNLSDKLIKIAPREKSGSRTANRYDYQKDWSILKILELQSTSEDYLLLFEHFDDIVLVDSPSAPKTLTFFQIKTKDNQNWTLNKLLKRRKKGDARSIIALMIDHISTFEERIRSINFITNAQFNITIDKTNQCCNKKKFNISCLSEADKALINKNIFEQTGIEIDDMIESITCFEVTPLSITDHRRHTLGHIADYLDIHYDRLHISATTIYKALFDEIKQKTSSESESFKTLCDLCKDKGISKADIDSLFTKFQQTPDWQEVWSEFYTRLNAEKYSISKLTQIKKAWRELITKEAGGGDILNAGVKQLILKSLTKILPQNNLHTIIDRVYSDIKKHKADFSEYYIKALTLKVYHEITEHQNLTEKS